MSKAITCQLVLVLVIAFGCTQDYDDFSSPEEATGAGGNAGGFGGAFGNAGAFGSAGTSVGTCASGFGNCNNQAGDGCEQDLTDDEHCGGCRNDCTSQGSSDGFACVSGVCGCTSDQQCREEFGGSGNATCNTASRTCVCDDTECRPGESCERQGGAQRCRCNGGTACMAGQTCCETPGGCRRLDTDTLNCGACGNACPMDFACQRGSCVQR
jgi:hypothetical protein